MSSIVCDIVQVGVAKVVSVLQEVVEPSIQDLAHRVHATELQSNIHNILTPAIGDRQV